MSMTMEQVVTQLQQDLFTLRAQVAAESGLADAVRAINILATAQVRKATPSLFDVKGLGHPKEFSGREEDFQHTSYEANDIVANSRKNPLKAWRRLQQRYDPTTGGRKRNLLHTIIPPGRVLFWNFKQEKKLKDKLDDEIKLAGLEALVPEELEMHLILNSNRLRTFEDARLEIVQANFGLRIRDSNPIDTRSRGHLDPMDVDAVNSLACQENRIIESA